VIGLPVAKKNHVMVVASSSKSGAHPSTVFNKIEALKNGTRANSGLSKTIFYNESTSAHQSPLYRA
jgi:ribosomal protein L35AE/L33A